MAVCEVEAIADAVIGLSEITPLLFHKIAVQDDEAEKKQKNQKRSHQPKIGVERIRLHCIGLGVNEQR